MNAHITTTTTASTNADFVAYCDKEAFRYPGLSSSDIHLTSKLWLSRVLGAITMLSGTYSYPTHFPSTAEIAAFLHEEPRSVARDLYALRERGQLQKTDYGSDGATDYWRIGAERPALIQAFLLQARGLYECERFAEMTVGSEFAGAFAYAIWSVTLFAGGIPKRAYEHSGETDRQSLENKDLCWLTVADLAVATGLPEVWVADTATEMVHAGRLASRRFKSTVRGDRSDLWTFTRCANETGARCQGRWGAA